MCVDSLWPHFAASQAYSPFTELLELKMLQTLSSGADEHACMSAQCMVGQKILKILLKGKLSF